MTDNLLSTIGLGLLLELALFLALRTFTRLGNKTISLTVIMSMLLVFVPWSILFWPGGDVFAIELGIFVVAAYILGIIGTAIGGEWHWGPALLISFFVLVVAVDIVFVSVAGQGSRYWLEWLLPAPRSGEEAVSRFPGVVSHDLQKKEAQYNEYLARTERQAELGWQVRKGWIGAAVSGKPAVFRTAVADREGQPVALANVNAWFIRPSDSSKDLQVLLPEVGPGVYEVQLTLPEAGTWQLVLKIRKGDDLHEERASTNVKQGVAR